MKVEEKKSEKKYFGLKQNYNIILKTSYKDILSYKDIFYI